MQDKMLKELSQVQAQYQTKLEPILEKRAEIFKRIPNFWLTALSSNPLLGSFFSDPDTINAMGYCKDLSFTSKGHLPGGFTIRLTFDENPYFKNSVIEKPVIVQDGLDLVGAPCAEIEWKEGMNISKRVAEANNERAMAEAGGKGKQRDIHGFQPTVTFFDLLTPENTDPTYLMMIKDEIYPNPRSSFTDFDDEGEFEEDEEEEEEGEEGSEGESGNEGESNEDDEAESDDT
eukprot:MONOS_1068.1-p1 / transcript=MONOS_1068.1 / gene=MONOS_1068 / organism=Monocercomonoides_exilis_PA203 / gene_product=unspecified product / transcript_product=unspecified product / location=Mono_scaffold00018:81209-82341(+) / protein_length=231 / sequence_SO=supercontig / SO=protein_coding / is_pseudo=false